MLQAQIKRERGRNAKKFPIKQGEKNVINPNIEKRNTQTCIFDNGLKQTSQQKSFHSPIRITWQSLSLRLKQVRRFFLKRLEIQNTHSSSFLPRILEISERNSLSVSSFPFYSSRQMAPFSKKNNKRDSSSTPTTETLLNLVPTYVKMVC